MNKVAKVAVKASLGLVVLAALPFGLFVLFVFGEFISK